MAYTSSFTGWTANDRPIADDLNRIEANAEAGAKPNTSSIFVQSLATVTSTVGVIGPNNLAHVSQTGRVRITVICNFENTTGAVRVVGLAPTKAGTLISNSTTGLAEMAVQTFPVAGFGSMTLTYYYTGATIGVSENYNFRMRNVAGSGVTLRSLYIQVEDT